MKNFLLPSLIVSAVGSALLFGTVSFAQQNNQNNATRDVSRVPREIQGCLSGASGNYTLTTETGVVFHVSGDNSVISPHAGQQVDVVGTEIVSTPSNVPANSNPQADANQTADTQPIAPPAFQVTKIQKIKDKCYSVK